MSRIALRALPSRFTRLAAVAAHGNFKTHSPPFRIEEGGRMGQCRAGPPYIRMRRDSSSMVPDLVPVFGAGTAFWVFMDTAPKVTE